MLAAAAFTRMSIRKTRGIEVVSILMSRVMDKTTNGENWSQDFGRLSHHFSWKDVSLISSHVNIGSNDVVGQFGVVLHVYVSVTEYRRAWPIARS